MSQEELAKIDIPATSMLAESKDKVPFSSEETLHVLLQAFYENFTTWLVKDNRPAIVELWRQNSRLIGKAVCLSDSDERIYGTVVDFTENGEILIQTEKGVNTYSYGDLSLRFK